MKTGQRIDGLIVIEDGLHKDDRVVGKGVQRARPGRKVDPVVPEPMEPSATGVGLRKK